MEPGTHRVEFFLIGTTTPACTPADFAVLTGQVTIVSCDAEECDVLGTADYTFTNSSTCTGISQDYFWNGTLVATLPGGASNDCSVLRRRDAGQRPAVPGRRAGRSGDGPGRELRGAPHRFC